jgi:hypothetical protein
MNSVLDEINNLYKEELSNYKYIEPKDIQLIEDGSYISYINNKLEKKHGYVISIRNKSNINNIIIELRNNNKRRHWFIYTKDMYIFVKEKQKDKFRDLLQSFLDNDFSNLTAISTKKTLKK